MTAEHGLGGLSKVTALERGPRQAKMHGIPEEQVIADFLLKESAVKRPVELDEVGALARVSVC